MSEPLSGNYDVIAVGSSFSVAFFLEGYLKQDRTAKQRILVIERGRFNDHAWQLENRRSSDIDSAQTFLRRGDPRKTWQFSIGFGGSSNCWTGNVPRMMPADFELHSRYGVGRDWPLGYDELEPFYRQVEERMAVAGGGLTPYPRSTPHPQPPHHLNLPETRIQAAFPDGFMPMPAARPRLPTRNRPACCANGVCSLCPADAKFTILNEMRDVFRDPRVTLVVGAEVRTVYMEGGAVRGVVARQDGRDRVVRGSMVVLGANGLFNPAILLRSGFEHPLLGRRLHEQVGRAAEVWLDGLDGFQGSTLVTGAGYMFYDGVHRRDRGACLVETHNIGLLRNTYGKWQQVLYVRFVFEDLPQERNRVVLDDPEGRPVAEYLGHSDYALRAAAAAEHQIGELLRPLPVEAVRWKDGFAGTEAHIQGTVVMGRSRDDSVVDGHMIHHDHRNLVVLGSSAFPTGAPANPTLTLSALALRTGAHLVA